MKSDISANFKQSTRLSWIELRAANGSTACYEAHSHDEFSFGLITQGDALYTNRGRTHRVGHGDVVTINPADVHACNPQADTWSYLMLFAEAKKMGEIQQDILQVSGADYLPFTQDWQANPRITARFISLFQAIQSESDLLKAQTAMYDFMAACFDEQLFDQTTKQQGDPDLWRIREKLFDEIDQVHQLEALAEEAGMSRFQLLRSFKQQYGLPPHAYLMDEKIKRAKGMLKLGQDLAEIAAQLGFSDQAHFQRQFKRRLAVTPKYYQSHFISSG